MPRAAFLFSLITLVPVPLLLAAGIWGGVWIWAALLWLAVLPFVLDELAALVPVAQEFPAADRLLAVLAVAHFGLLAVAVRALGQGGNAAHETIALFLAFGLFFGQVSNPAAHELIHRTERRLFALGKWMFISLLFGHHVSAHRLVHHVHVATARDPNTARSGESFYAFWPRAWWGSFRAGFIAETRRVGRDALRHPYPVYVAGGLAMPALAWLIGGWHGVLAYLLLAFHAQSQLLLSDYVQHYGLQRGLDGAGRAEPVGPEHSWNAPHWFSHHLMLAAPRHSDHHLNPARPYPALELSPGGQEVPLLPHGLPLMGAIALFPGRWRRLMDRRAREWRARAPGIAGRRRHENAPG